MESISSLIINSLMAPLVLGGAAVLWRYLEKKTDLRLKELEKKINENDVKTKKDVGTIYNVISALLSAMQASRVYIIQPHPLDKNEFISVIYEVTDMGIMPIKGQLVDCPAENMPVFVGEISQRDFLYYKSTNMLKGKRSRAFFSNVGTESLIIKHLSDDKSDWIGSIVVDYMHETNVAPDYSKALLQDAADKIQFILPPVK